MQSTKQYTLAELTDGLEIDIKGDPHCLISGVSTIQSAQPGHITFLTNAHYRKHLPETKASAVILSTNEASDCRVNAIISRNPYFIYAKIAERFSTVQTTQPGIHTSSVIGDNADIHPTASVAAHCVVGANVRIGAGVVIGPGCYIGDDVTIDNNTILDARVTIYSRVTIGKRVRLASGVVIGCDGFGFANQHGQWHKVPQLGSVEIADDVDIGANTTIDRGAIENTVIEAGVKLDNLIQVGHNVKIGAHTIIAGCVAIAGSATIGKGCMIGGTTAIAGHVSIADNVICTGMTSVTKSITESGMYSSGIVGAVPNIEFRKNNARFYRLDSLMKRVKQLEQAIIKIIPVSADKLQSDE
jgi:UDP-3-O-[3-hydroxymyristoyl] glucosamine N-acyltransferase